MIGKGHTKLRLGCAIGATLVSVVAAQPGAGYNGPPDTRDAAAAAAEAYAATHGFQGAPDTRDAVAAARQAIAAKAVANHGFLGSPDTRDAVAAARRAIASGTAFPPRVTFARSVGDATPATPAGFDWSDFGVGVGVALGSILLLGAVALVAWSTRHRRHETGTPALT